MYHVDETSDQPVDVRLRLYPAHACLRVFSLPHLSFTDYKKCRHNDVLEEFIGAHFSTAGAEPTAWDRLLDSDLGDPSGEQCRTIKSVLVERMIRPFTPAFNNPDYGAAYSAILFGPPGTAKSSICEALAQRMGYDFCVIDTAAFLADGLSNVSARIKYVFRRLMVRFEPVVATISDLHCWFTSFD